MVSPHGIELAVHVISTFYGDLCSNVCGCLLRRGALNLVHIIRITGLSRENVVNCLRILIHQNCVQAFSVQQEGAFGEAAKVVTHYMALFDNIVNKLRASKSIQIVWEELGEKCQEIFQGLIQHGRQSFDQIVDRLEQKTDNFDVQVVNNNFRRLLSARFIERCPAPEPFLAPPTEEETSTKKRGSKFAKNAQQQTIEQRASAAAAPMESIRFLMEMDDFSEEKDKETESPKVGDKRKQDVLKSDEDVLDANRKKEVLWRVNCEEFVRRLLHKACVSYVRTKYNNEASIVLEAILDLSRRRDTRLKAEISPYLPIDDIYDEVIKKDGGVGMDLERVSSSLEQLRCQTLDESYSIDIKSIIQMAQNEEVESVVKKRYGGDAFIIFRLLLTEDRLFETDKIAELTLVEKTEAVKILYKMWKDGYVQMEKVSATGARQQLTFNLWRVEQQRLQELFLDEMYHAILNLRLRITLEEDRNKEFDRIKDKWRIYRIGRSSMERALMNLDDAGLLFHHFLYAVSSKWTFFLIFIRLLYPTSNEIPGVSGRRQSGPLLALLLHKF